MPSVLIVNNYPTRERFERLRSCVRENDVTTGVCEWNEVSAGRFARFDGVVLSGSPDMMSKKAVQSKYRAEIDAIVDSVVPVFGVCFGHQMMAHAFGSEVTRDMVPVLEFVKTDILLDDPIFAGLPKSVMLLESRHEVVKSLPKGFSLLATSGRSEVAAMRHMKRPLYGVQSHPERHTLENPHGSAILANFVGSLG